MVFEDRECCVCKKVRYNVSIPCEHPICIICVIDYRGGKCPVCKEPISSLIDEPEVKRESKFCENFILFLIFMVIGIIFSFLQTQFKGLFEWADLILRLLHAFSH